MLENIAFYIVFLSQVILISIYLPNKMVARMSQVLERHPMTEYPKLYPAGASVEAKKINQFKLMYQMILLIGILLLLSSVALSQTYAWYEKHSEAMPLLFGMLQFTPFVFLEISGCKQLSLMRKASKSKLRTATLKPRRLFDFVSPALLTTAVLGFVFYIMVEFFINVSGSSHYSGWQFHWGVDGVIRLSSLILCNGLFIFLGIKNLSGKRSDPHQSENDRIKQIEFSLKSMLVTSIIASLFFIITIVVDKFGLNYLEIIINSLYFQLIALVGIGGMLASLKLENMNLQVYKI